LLIGTIAALVVARRRKLLGNRVFVAVLCAMPVTCLVCAMVLYPDGQVHLDLSPIFYAGYPWFRLYKMMQVLILNSIALGTLPWIPLASVPLILHYQRHR